jgi:hypothetical protein
VKTIYALFLLLLSFPLLAIERVTTLPEVVPSGHAVVVQIPGCSNSAAPTLSRLGFFIEVVLPHPQPCNSFRRDIRLEALPAGEYSVSVVEPNGPAWAFGSFVVLEEGESAFDVRPFAVPENTPGVEFHLLMKESQVALCPQLNCFVRFGNIQATVKRFGDTPFELIVEAPPLQPGLHTVTIDNGLEEIEGGQVYAWREPSDLFYFERILFPLLLDAQGANGSRWITEGTIANPQRWPIITANTIVPIECVTFPCTELLAPGSKLKWLGGQYPHGAALLVSKPDAEDLAFSLRARDISRVADGFGTEIPVVRERDLFTGTMTLLDVPRDPRYRVKLRVYAYGAVDGQEGAVKYGGTTVPLFFDTSCSGGADCKLIPAYAEVDIPAGEAGERTNVYIHAPLLTEAWAFASVTNNETQQVTIVTPDGTGGEPR